jgi:uncharacterized protein YegP (UPF0339 family)
MAAKFVVFKGKDGQSYFRLLAANSQAIFSSQGYKTRASYGNGMKSVANNAAGADGKKRPDTRIRPLFH